MATNVNERNVPDTPTNKMLDCLWEARNLSLYTVKICSNTNNFPPEYYQTMTGDMIKKAKDIYRLGKEQTQSMFKVKQDMKDGKNAVDTNVKPFSFV